MQVENKTQNDEKEQSKENIDPADDDPKPIPYVPGDLTDEKHRSEDYYKLAENRYNDKQPEPRKGYPRIGDDFSILPQPEKDLSKDVDEFLKTHKEMLNETYSPEKHKDKESVVKQKLLSPILAAISNFNLAKKLHKENLEHDPLPDTITDSMYRKLQMQRNFEQDPGLALDDKNFACAVGWKGYPGYGPTKCTKLKVYRPKTCDHVKTRPDRKDGSRPSSSIESFDKKWRFIRQSKVSPIDLAICWDLAPEDPKDEPKRPTHIDGSNGSLAPAVFTLVHTPKEEVEQEEVPPKCDGVHKCGPIFDHGARAYQEKDFIFDRPRTTGPKGSRQSSSNASGKSDSSKKRTKSAHNLRDDEVEKHSQGEKGSHSSGKSELSKGKIHQSTPNLSHDSEPSSVKPCKQHSCKKLGRRLCVACELKNISEDRRAKSEYKMAFKAGVPHKYNDKRQDYPEHWRLATVYQHSYKPIHARKRPLLQTVFK